MRAPAGADTLVIGAGLAGLATALLLHEAGQHVQVLEARNRAGGRIHSIFDGAVAVADLGPTWIWTPYQPVAARWLARLRLEVFDQYEHGPGIYEPGQGAPATPVQMPVQYGSQRVVGASQALVERLVASLPASAVRTASPISAIEATADGVEVSVEGDAPCALRAHRVVVAMPPRLAASALEWRPDLARPLEQALLATPTWMASHAKAVVRYERAFWRVRGLSGRLASRVGPLVEAHDHCGPEGTPAALFGFVGWPPALRASRGAPALVDAIAEQLVRCFGADAPRPLAIEVHDWSGSVFTASPRDLAGPMPHPSVGPEILREAHLDGRLRFAASETATLSPGLIEGAFDAAERVVGAILGAG